MSARVKYIILLLLTIIGIAFFMGLKWYFIWQKPNVITTKKLYITSQPSWSDLQDSIRLVVEDFDAFMTVAEKEALDRHLRPGRYSIQEGWNNKELVRFLKFGAQDELPIRIGNYRTVMQLAHRVTPHLEMDSLSLMEAMAQSKLTKGLENYQWHYFIMPNTYHFYWAITPDKWVQKMEEVYEQFWNQERMQKAKKIGFSPYQVMTLASIVQLESYQEEEQPTVAGVYLNRLKRGQRLEADPTVIFAWSVAYPNEEVLQRVYFKHLQLAHPYNTYRNTGLPPGPICIPNISAVEAVLNAEVHNYYFFVADPNRVGYHIFASTFSEHKENATRYRNSLNL